MSSCHAASVSIFCTTRRKSFLCEPMALGPDLDDRVSAQLLDPFPGTRPTHPVKGVPGPPPWWMTLDDRDTRAHHSALQEGSSQSDGGTHLPFLHVNGL